jgi:hypothetical protein
MTQQALKHGIRSAPGFHTYLHEHALRCYCLHGIDVAVDRGYGLISLGLPAPFRRWWECRMIPPGTRGRGCWNALTLAFWSSISINWTQSTYLCIGHFPSQICSKISSSSIASYRLWTQIPNRSSPAAGQRIITRYAVQPQPLKTTMNGLRHICSD